MAKRQTRRRWRRPERMTLEAPSEGRRKTVGTPTDLILDPVRQRHASGRRVRLMTIAFVVVAAAEGFAIGFLVDHSISGTVIGAATGAVYVLVASRLGDLWIVRSLEAERARNPRLNRLAERLAELCGMAGPRVLVVRDDAMDALALGSGKGTVIATTGSLNAADLGMEGMIAEQIVHIRDGEAKVISAYTGLAAPGGPLFALWILLAPAGLVVRALRGWLFPPSGQHRGDVAAALLTRYPPGIADALRASARARRPGPRVLSPFWFSYDADRRADLVADM